MISQRELQEPSRFDRNLVWMPFGVLLICVIIIRPLLATERRYEVGKILDLKTLDLQAPVPFLGTSTQVPFATQFQFQIQANNIVYITGCVAKKGSYDPVLAENDSVQFRVDKSTVYIRRTGGNELKLALLTRVRLSKNNSEDPEKETIETIPPYRTHMSVPECR